ncbi:hypothetical protein HNY73_020516 [Argiope bruennichi]|uniref:Uncharacterized protein n=3 Tax=Argiope bruennichi TaxID=94029 RepID=A0A8T0EAV8_ARGBR|nr:hypothetical protein HNY73_020516 [Argiope bruennichi]
MFGHELNFAKSEIGEGTMDLKDLDKCFRATTCLDEEFIELRKCYAMMEEEETQKAISIIKESAGRANVVFMTNNVDGMRDEYCALNEKQKEDMYKEGLDPLLDMYALYCMSYKTKKHCDRLESFLDCGFSIMERYAEEGKCTKSEDTAE